MKSLVQYCSILVFLGLLGEIVETRESYKISRPYKYYQRKPWHPPRWHGYPSSSKYQHPKRTRSKDYFYPRPRYNRYHPPEEDFVDQSSEVQPYTIVIQLPKREDRYKDHVYQRNYNREFIPPHVRDVDYIEDDEDFDDRTIRTDNKNVRIRVTKGENPKLHIKISRADSTNDIEIIDKTNVTAIPRSNLTMSTEPSNAGWVPSSPSLLRPPDPRRKYTLNESSTLV